MDILNISKRLEDKLISNGYCGQRIGSGCTVDGHPVRDFQYYYSEKKPTEEIVSKYLKDISPLYVAKLKLNDDNFRVFVEEIS